MAHAGRSYADLLRLTWLKVTGGTEDETSRTARDRLGFAHGPGL